MKEKRNLRSREDVESSDPRTQMSWRAFQQVFGCGVSPRYSQNMSPKICCPKVRKGLRSSELGPISDNLGSHRGARRVQSSWRRLWCRAVDIHGVGASRRSFALGRHDRSGAARRRTRRNRCSVRGNRLRGGRRRSTGGESDRAPVHLRSRCARTAG